MGYTRPTECTRPTGYTRPTGCFALRYVFALRDVPVLRDIPALWNILTLLYVRFFFDGAQGASTLAGPTQKWPGLPKSGLACHNVN